MLLRGLCDEMEAVVAEGDADALPEGRRPPIAFGFPTPRGGGGGGGPADVVGADDERNETANDERF